MRPTRRTKNDDARFPSIHRWTALSLFALLSLSSSRALASPRLSPSAFRDGIYVDAGRPLPEQQMAAPEDEPCLTCHSPTRADHPIGVTPNGPLPSDLPLGSDGRMICLTCHFSHAGGDTPAGQRMPTDQLCRTCHPY